MTSPDPNSYQTLMEKTYARRAATYDASSGGYHIDLARDFVDFLSPQTGDVVLDLASGTGLIAIDIASRVGPTGKVIAVDFSPEMQALAKSKFEAAKESSNSRIAEITWVLANITSETLLTDEPIREVLETHGGFDIITMCQGYMYLSHLQEAFTFWTTNILRSGGRLISDMTTEDPTLQYLLTYHLPLALTPNDTSTHLSSGRVHITSQRDFEDLFTGAGLEVVQTVRTKMYGPEYWFAADEATGLDVLEGEIERNLPWVPETERLTRAKEVWPGIWREAVTTGKGGKKGVEGRHPFYICIGKKPV